MKEKKTNNSANQSLKEDAISGDSNLEIFRFHGIIQTRFSNVVVFLNSSKKLYLPILLDLQRISIVKNFVNKLLGINACGIYSLLYYFIFKSKLIVHSVFLGFSSQLGLPLVSIIIVNKKNKIQNISQLFILPEDAAVCSILYQVPIIINDERAKELLTYPIGETKEEDLLNVLENHILSAELEMENKFN